MHLGNLCSYLYFNVTHDYLHGWRTGKASQVSCFSGECRKQYTGCTQYFSNTACATSTSITALWKMEKATQGHFAFDVCREHSVW